MWSSLKNYSDAAILFARVVLGILLLLHFWPGLRDAVLLWGHHGHSFWKSLFDAAVAGVETAAAILKLYSDRQRQRQPE